MSYIPSLEIFGLGNRQTVAPFIEIENEEAD